MKKGNNDTYEKTFTCTVEPRWNKPTFTMRRKVSNKRIALKLAVKLQQLSGGFNFYSNFRYEGELIDTEGYIHLRNGKLIKVKK